MDGAVHTYKARLVAKGYTQTPGIDYEETFSPVADIRAIRILIAIAAYYDYEIWQMDVKTAFLNGYLNEEVYMEQPEGFVNPKYPNRVCKLKRSIYGLKQASRQWNKRFDDEIKKFGFSQNADEPCVYLKASGSNVTFLILYVDDILIMGNNIPMLQDVKSYLGKCFAMKDLGEAAYILGIKIYRDRSRRLIGLCQSAYIKKILKRYHMENSKRGSIPMQEKLRLSKSQAEYIAAFDVSKEAVWVRKFIYGLGVVPTIEKPINMYCDNTGAIAIANESGITKGARHFRAKVHYLRKVIEFGDIKLEKVHTDDNLSDPLGILEYLQLVVSCKSVFISHLDNWDCKTILFSDE
ncbi:retrotransposon protein, putative, ty1-copia subclass [Tanacetum coccineum]